MSDPHTEEHTPHRFIYPSTARQFPKRKSPLAAAYSCPGFVVDQATGLVQRNPVKDDEVSP